MILAIILGLAFCPWLGSPLQYVHWGDRLRTTVPFYLAFGAPCESQKDGHMNLDDGPDCIRYGAPRVFKGVWIDRFEGSKFLEGRKPTADIFDANAEVWLDVPAPLRDPAGIRIPGSGPTIVAEMEFVGRKTLYPGVHGHLGGTPHNIIVDKVLVFRPVEVAN